MSEPWRALAFLASTLLWAAVGVAWAAEAGILARLRWNWRAYPPLRRALAALAVAAAVAYAGGKGEGVSSKEQVVSAESSSSIVAVDGTRQDVDHDTYSSRLTPYYLNHAPSSLSLSDRDISRGYRLMSVVTNEAQSYEMPPNARLVGTWHLTDAYDAVAKAGLDEPFPLGGQVVTSLWAHVWGRARPLLGNASNELVAVGAPMFARRGVSRLWTAATTNGSVLLTWQNFFFKGARGVGVSSKEQGTEGKVVSSKEQVVSAEFSSSSVAVDGTQQDVAHHTYSLLPTPYSFSSVSPVSAQLELFRDGSFVAWSNSVARAYRRVNPDDWDGDGIPNAEDEDSRVAADEPRFGPRQTLPPGAHTNNYFWVDLVVRDADALVSFAGDAPSNLPDPAFVARAGETNRVTLLIGKAYAVSCRMPFGIVGKSSDAVEVRQEPDGTLRLQWPVAIGIREGEGAGGEGTRGDGVSSKEEVVSAEFSSSAVAADGTQQDVALHTYSLLLPPYSLSAVTAGGTRQDVALHTYSSLLPPYSLSAVAAGGRQQGVAHHTYSLLPTPSSLTTPSSFTMVLTPPWLVGSFAWTNGCCRVSGDGPVFSLACGDGCACGGCAAAGFFAYEGYRLPVRGGSCPCNGSGGAVVPGEIGGEEPDPLPGASARFSKRVILFEDEYEDAPGVSVPWRSTETELDCSASGGPNGGRVRIEARGADGLVPYGGLPLPFERELGPFESVAFRNAYRAVRPSGGEGDIVVTATFEENGTGAAWTSEDRATAVRLKFEPVALAPANKSAGRHSYGIYEEVKFEQSPTAPMVEWGVTAGAFSKGETRYTCPMHVARNPVKASCGGVEYTPKMTVVEPRAITADSPGWDDFDAPIGEAGSIVMLLPLYIVPMDVSFGRVAVEEVPHEDHPNNGDEHVGYFSRSDLRLWWHHTRDNGAGVWRDVDEGTHRMGGGRAFDQAGVTETLPRVNSSGLFVDDPDCGWSYGRIVMSTPFGWNAKGTRGEALPCGMFALDVQAVLELQADGTFRVEKLNNEVIRRVDGEVILNGVKQK